MVATPEPTRSAGFQAFRQRVVMMGDARESFRGIVYLSEAETDFDDAALNDLAAHAAGRNAELGVTGYLYFERSRFLQYIEGAPQLVTDLMERIEQDDRHSVLLASRQDGIAERRFPGWSMRRLDRNDVVSIRLETVLADYMFLNSSLPPDLPFSGGQMSWDDTVWRFIDRLADLRTSLPVRR